jgi:hypothetical protein
LEKGRPDPDLLPMLLEAVEDPVAKQKLLGELNKLG